MGKGASTKQAILDRAMSLASSVGLEGLTIGGLAEKLELSKSGLFAHFQSKEMLQIKVLDNAAAYFAEAVVRPALLAPRGRPRVEALCKHWMIWAKPSKMLGGCVFVAASSELDDRPGPVRDHLVELQREWLDTRVRVIRTGVTEGHFRADLDCEQYAHELYGIMMAFHYSARLMRDPKSKMRAEISLEALLDRASKPGKTK